MYVDEGRTQDDPEDYTSQNTDQLDVEQTKALIAALPEMQAVLAGGVR